MNWTLKKEKNFRVLKIKDFFLLEGRVDISQEELEEVCQKNGFRFATEKELKDRRGSDFPKGEPRNEVCDVLALGETFEYEGKSRIFHARLSDGEMDRIEFALGHAWPRWFMMFPK